jgi:hypothetical protein
MAKPAGKTVNVKLAVVGIFFGTGGTPAPGATGVAATKFADAPSAAIDAAGPLQNLIDAISADAVAGRIQGCKQFGVELTTAKRIKTIFAEYAGRPKFKNGLYSLSDSSYVGNEDINPKLAWQYYIYDKNFHQVEADGLNENRTIKDDLDPKRRLFHDGDIVIFRCVLIAKGPLTFVPPVDLSRPITLS